MGKTALSYEEITKEILLDFGVPTELKGYRYLLDAIAAAAKAENILNVKIKDLFAQLATTYGDTVAGVDAAITQAIEETWSRNDIGMLSQFFGYLSTCVEPPDNMEFIIFVADKVQLHKRFS